MWRAPEQGGGYVPLAVFGRVGERFCSLPSLPGPLRAHRMMGNPWPGFGGIIFLKSGTAHTRVADLPIRGVL